jgi:hypothetical protein
MIETDFEENHSTEWIRTHIKFQCHYLLILRKIIPWKKFVDSLVTYYSQTIGAKGINIRTISAICIYQKLEQLSDRKVIERIQENDYAQYFCNIPPDKPHHFLDSSSLCVFRKRIGVEGVELMEEKLFFALRQAGVIQADALLQDSSVLESNIIYPTDIHLVYKALDKMQHFAKKKKITIWWDHKEVLQLRRSHNLESKPDVKLYLQLLTDIFVPALEKLKELIPDSEKAESEKRSSLSDDLQFLQLLLLFKKQNDLKL